MGQAVRKIWNIVTSVLVVMFVILAILLAGVRLIGLQAFTVLSGSMEPTYHVGALIYVKKVDPSEIQVGDAITFLLSEDTVATHRVVEIVPDEEDPSVLRFRTKGDANNAVDGSLVHCGNVIGVPVFTIPYLGYVANYVQKPPGLYVTISVCAVLLFLAILPDLFAAPEAAKEGRKAGGRRSRGGRPSSRRAEEEAARYDRERHTNAIDGAADWDEFEEPEELVELVDFETFGEAGAYREPRARRDRGARRVYREPEPFEESESYEEPGFCEESGAYEEQEFYEEPESFEESEYYEDGGEEYDPEPAAEDDFPDVPERRRAPLGR